MQNKLKSSDFEKVDMRVGTIINATHFSEAKKPAFKLTIDFGFTIGILKSSAQITANYKVETLIGKQIVAVINFPPKQIANFMSECLVLGAVGIEGDVVLLSPDFKLENGLKIS